MVRAIDFNYVIMRDGADYRRIYPTAGSVPSVRMDDSGEIKMSFSGEFLDPGDGVSWLTDQIRPELVIDGTPYPLGIYLPATVQSSETDTTAAVQIEAYDRCWQVQSHVTETMKYFPAGTAYLSAIGSLISECGITAIAATDSDLALSEAREWDVGTSNLEIVNQLLSEINYKSLWFDQNGIAIIEPIAQLRAENIRHVIDDTKTESLVIPGMNRSLDIYSAPNVFICVCSNADKSGPMVATAENTNPQSPLSIARRGRRIAQVVPVENVASQAALQAYANQLVTNSMMRGDVINITTGLHPDYGVGDVVALRYGDTLALCVIRAWEMNLTVGGKMIHTLERVMMNVE